MKQISGYEVREFTYESRTRRNYHIAEMESDGWEEDGKVKRLKDDVSILDATEADYEWYARFYRMTMK